jgi:hypothetical protein
MASRYREIDPSALRTYSITERPHKVSLEAFATKPQGSGTFREFVGSLPHILAGSDLRAVVSAVAAARRSGRAVVWCMGAHVIKCGLAPVVVGLMERGVVTAVAMNGAGAIHDAEAALFGATSEDVESALAEGTFGMARETADLLNGCAQSAREGALGFGEALGYNLVEAPNASASILASGHRLEIPITVHVALGTDIVHMHPSADGAAIGDASLRDFRILTAAMEQLTEGGVLFNVGSAVLLPEVVLKVMAILSNLGRLRGFTGVNIDFIQQYRPTQQIVRRVRQLGGRGYAITGHHEVLVPLLAWWVLHELEGLGGDATPPGRFQDSGG